MSSSIETNEEDPDLSGEGDEYDPQWNIKHLRATGTVRSKGSVLQLSPFDSIGRSTASLFLNFIVEPKGEWEKLAKYRGSKVSEQIYEKHDYVFVLPSGQEPIDSQPKNEESNFNQFWVAKILEIRARDGNHVYARVYWMYSPDELPVLNDCGISKAGRRDYHGRHELIASNHMDILSVDTFAGLAYVTAWQENDDDEAQTGLYWRQTFDYRTATLSELKRYCICESYYNPDNVLVSCPNPQCAIWLHTECLIDSILTQKFQSCLRAVGVEATKDNAVVAKNSKPKSKKKAKIGPAEKPYEGVFSAEIVGGQEGDDEPLRAEITDLRLGSDDHGMKKWKEIVVCPRCSTTIE